ncbi:hypothetical protein BIW11_12187 [Tropilaelaps mercedesae]|uniref:Uncharacterized protein n=1 Tax=Tropilaelaps mercedesae TaxID=418985 RepID=A0A1V9X841_9ACAR|nr:hypothetical protein BIW11_12187 [Tropilaelaps mercedesae]
MAPNNFTVVRGLKSDKCSLWEPYLLSKPEEKATTTSTSLAEKRIFSREDNGSNLISRSKALRRIKKKEQSAAPVFVGLPSALALVTTLFFILICQNA